MFQLVIGRIIIPGLIIFAFLRFVFWVRKRKVAQKSCCQGKCHEKKGPARGSEESEGKKDANDA